MTGRTDIGSPDCEYATLAVARALHAAEPEDEIASAEHLPHCAACRAALADALAVAAVIGAAVPSLDPPESLRARVLAQARDHQPTRESAPESLPSWSSRSPSSRSAPPPPEDPPPTSGARSTVGRASRGLLLTAAAVVLGMVLLVGQVLVPGSSENDQMAQDGAETSALTDRAQDVVADAQAQDPDVRHAMLRSRDGRTVAVVLDDGSTAPTGAGSDQVAGGGVAAQRVVALDMPAPDEGGSWVLWGTAGAGTGGPTAIGIVDRSTGTPIDIGVEPPEGGWRGYAVSVEQGQSVPENPGRVVAVGPVAA